jgi:PII-like signaling protein
VTAECLKLTVYFGERDRAGGRFLADTLAEIYARHRLEISLVMRGVEGFGLRHHLHTDRLLSLSEDLPLVSVAVDSRPRIETALQEITQLRFDGLVTLERARMVGVSAGPVELAEPVELPGEAAEATKLTVYVGRHQRVAGQPAYVTVVDLLRRGGSAGATVLLGVDGTAGGLRRRARFFGANADVPLMIIALGSSRSIASILPELRTNLSQPLVTLERVRICKRDGQRLAEPHQLPETDRAGLPVWQKLMVYTGEDSRSGDHALHHQLIRRLRAAGASGTTSLRGIWGYQGGERPHGDSFWKLRRRAPVVTITVDTPERARRWFALVDELTSETGLVTSEMVPAFRATGAGISRGGLSLADLGA